MQNPHKQRSYLHMHDKKKIYEQERALKYWKQKCKRVEKQLCQHGKKTKTKLDKTINTNKEPDKTRSKSEIKFDRKAEDNKFKIYIETELNENIVKSNKLEIDLKIKFDNGKEELLKKNMYDNNVGKDVDENKSLFSFNHSNGWNKINPPEFANPWGKNTNPPNKLDTDTYEKQKMNHFEWDNFSGYNANIVPYNTNKCKESNGANSNPNEQNENSFGKELLSNDANSDPDERSAKHIDSLSISESGCRKQNVFNPLLSLDSFDYIPEKKITTYNSNIRDYCTMTNKCKESNGANFNPNEQNENLLSKGVDQQHDMPLDKLLRNVNDDEQNDNLLSKGVNQQNDMSWDNLLSNVSHDEQNDNLLSKGVNQQNDMSWDNLLSNVSHDEQNDTMG